MILARFDELQAAASALGRQLIESIQEGLSERGTACVALPGGRTPLPLFEAVRNAPLDWSRVVVTLTDERWVPESDPASNAALVRTALLGSAAQAARFVPLYNGAADATAATRAAWDAVRHLCHRFDAVVLGMGEDGHFASLFAGNSALRAALDPAAAPGCVAMRAPAAPMDRISLNLAALLQTRRLFLLVSGKRKEEILMHAAEQQDFSKWPVTSLLVQRQRVPEVFWAP